MTLDPIQQHDLSYQVYQRIRDMILSGELKAGEKIPQEKIATRLGVSRMPLHKAFAMCLRMNSLWRAYPGVVYI